jgi:hypothetical protein
VIRPPPPSHTVKLVSFEDESRLFMRLRATLAWETIRSMRKLDASSKVVESSSGKSDGRLVKRLKVMVQFSAQ